MNVSPKQADREEKEKEDDAEQKIRQQWTTEQKQVAAQVTIANNQDDDHFLVTENDKFRLFSLQQEEYSTTAGSHPSSHITEKLSSDYFGGVDVSFPTQEEDTTTTDPAVAVYVVLSLSTHQVVYEDYEYFDLTLPYIPTFLGFREIDPIQKLIHKQKSQAPQYTPRVIFVDGNGRWHPQRAGMACFVGVRTGIPTIGIGKSLYCMNGMTHTVVDNGIQASLQQACQCLPILISNGGGGTTVHKEQILIDKQCLSPEIEKITLGTSATAVLIQALANYCRGLAVPLPDDDDDDNNKVPLAYALVGHGGRMKSRGRNSVVGGTKNPIFISVGHAVSLKTAVQLTALWSHARIPEPIRQADLRGRQRLRERSSEQQESALGSF